jgi:hypothetical protein
MGRPVVHRELLSRRPERLAAFDKSLSCWKVRRVLELDLAT